MNKKYNWLELAEFFSIGSFFFGVISTAITKQILFSLTPLIFVIFFNIINRKKHNYQADKILEQQQQIQELQQQLINFTDEYKSQKLELENLRVDVNKQELELENNTEKSINNIREEGKSDRLEQQQQIQELQQQLINFTDEYETQKLELENLKVDVKKQELELENKPIKYIDKMIEESRIQIFNDYNYKKLELEKLIEKVNKQQLELNKLIKEINNQRLEQEHKTNEYMNIIEEAKKQILKLHKELENVENDIGIGINGIGEDINNFFENIKKNPTNLTDFTKYYPLQGLTEKLIKEVENSGYIEDLDDNKTKKLDNYAMECLKTTADSCEELARIVTRYYYDNQCRQEEAHQLDFELRQLASILRQCNSVYDLELMYQVIELFTFQISRFKHNKTHYCWDNLMRKNLISKLDKCKYNQYKSNSNQEKISNELNSGLKPFSRYNKWGYKDSNNNVVITPTFDYAWDFSGNLAKVKKEVWGNYKYGLINSQGDIVLPIEYYSIEPFCEGMARITQESWGNYQYGFINEQGNLVIPIEYDYAESFNNGLAKVKKKNHSFYIDKQGNKV